MNTSLAWASLSDLKGELASDVIKAEEALEFASFILHSLSGRKYGPTRITTEAYDTRSTLMSGAQPYPALINGEFYNISSCSKCSCAGCGVFHRTRLRGYPVSSIIDVWINGCVLSRDEYVLLDNSVLGLTSAATCNAKCIVVQYAYGTGVPPGGKRAVAKLAEELLESARGGECSLPERVTSISRQGTSWTLLDPQDFLDQGRTGIYEIDMLLRALNPTGALARPRVFSPDLERATAYQYNAPPLSLMLRPGDQVTVKGQQGRWVSSDPALVAAVRKGERLGTVLSDGTLLSGHWHELAPGGGGVVLDITPGEAAHMMDRMSFTVSSTTDNEEVHTGIVRVLDDR